MAGAPPPGLRDPAPAEIARQSFRRCARALEVLRQREGEMAGMDASEGAPPDIQFGLKLSRGESASVGVRSRRRVSPSAATEAAERL